MRGKKISYLVQWKGYNRNEATLEPQSSLQHCRDLIAQYEREQNGEEDEDE